MSLSERLSQLETSIIANLQDSLDHAVESVELARKIADAMDRVEWDSDVSLTIGHNGHYDVVFNIERPSPHRQVCVESWGPKLGLSIYLNYTHLDEDYQECIDIKPNEVRRWGPAGAKTIPATPRFVDVVPVMGSVVDAFQIELHVIRSFMGLNAPLPLHAPNAKVASL